METALKNMVADEKSKKNKKTKEKGVEMSLGKIKLIFNINSGGEI